jgi:hypothetical protein
MSSRRLRFTGIVEPGAYRLDDFVCCEPRFRPRIPGVARNVTVYIHLPTNEAWSAEMVDAVFPPIPDELKSSVRVNTRLTFKRLGGLP